MTKINPRVESPTITTEQDKVGIGGAACQKLVDATELLAPAYGTSAQFSRDLLGATETDTRYELTLALLPGDAAKQVIADIRAGLAGCRGTYTMADTTGGVLTDAEQELQVDPLGDSSVAYLDRGTIAGSPPSDSYCEFVQVGPAVVEVTVIPEDDAVDAGKFKEQLATVSKAQVAKLAKA